MTQLCRLNHAHRHGASLHCYDTGKCRCDPCRKRKSDTAKRNRKLKAYGRFRWAIDPTGTKRRIQGLQVLGWTMTHIGEASGMQKQAVQRVLGEKWIEPSTKDRIDAGFAKLIRAGAGPSNVTRQRSITKGWLSPFAWDDIDNDPAPANTPKFDPDAIDEVRVQHAVDGRPGARLTGAERRAAVKILHARKWTDNRIATQLGCHEQTVFRIRGELGLAAFDFSELVKQEAA